MSSLLPAYAAAYVVDADVVDAVAHAPKSTSAARSSMTEAEIGREYKSTNFTTTFKVVQSINISRG